MTVDTPPPLTTPASTGTTPRRRKRWRKYIMASGIALLLIIWMMPTIIARTPLRNRIVQSVTKDLRGTVTVGSASLGWFSVIELRDVAVTDHEGRTLLSVPRITSTKSLASLLRNRADLGEFLIERPDMRLICEKKTTNLEDVLAAYLADDASPEGERSAILLRIVEGTIHLHDVDRQHDWDFTVVNAKIDVPRSRDDMVAVTLSTKCGNGSLESDLALGRSGRAALMAKAFPLEPLAAALHRFEPRLELGGQLTANLNASWTNKPATPPTFDLHGHAAITNFDLSGPWLNGDRLRLASVELPITLATRGDSIAIERAQLICDAGRLAISGTFDPDVPFDRWLDQPGMSAEADLDLARIAKLLPRMLHVRPGTAITDGRLVFKIASTSTPTGTTWSGDIRTSSLKGTRDGQAIEWREPLSVVFTGRFPHDRLPIFDQLICRSDFIAINAKSEPGSLKAAANIYLDVLSTRLAEFIDLEGYRFGGTAAARLVASRTPQGNFTSRFELDLEKALFLNRAGQGIHENSVFVRLTAEGLAVPRSAIRIDRAEFNLTTGSDELHLELAEPLADLRQITSATLSTRLTGDFGRWMGRIGGLARVPAHYVFAGQMSATGLIRFRKDRLHIDRLALSLERVRFRGAGLDLDEPTMNATANMTLIWATTTTTFDTFHLHSAPLTVTGGQLVFETQSNGLLAVFGGGPATTNLTRLGKTLKLSTDPSGADALHGTGVGPIHFRNLGSTTTFNGTLDIKNFAYGRPAETGISEASLQLEADGYYVDTLDTVTLTRAKIARPGLTIDGKGSLGQFDTTQDIDLTGTLTYDLAQLTPDVRAAVGGGFEAVGHGTRPFSIVGSLAPRPQTQHSGQNNRPPAGPLANLTANAALSWDSIKAYGFEMGPSELTANLANGTMQVSPIRAAFAGSSITLTPTIQFEPGPSFMSFAKGRIVERARLTPQVLAGGMGYVLPAIANATQAEGDVSMILGSNRLPLADFTKSTVQGELHVHRATVSAGPVITQLAQLLGGPTTQFTLASDMIVPVRIENGRVHHESFSLNFNGVVVKTSGSVGFDGTLAMIADVPVPTAAFKNNPRLMQALSGKRVPVPIGGTISKPMLDPRQFQAAVAKLAQDSLKDVGRDVLNKELEKVFPFKK